MIAAAQAADVVIYIGGLNHDKGLDCEGADRVDMKLPFGQDDYSYQNCGGESQNCCRPRRDNGRNGFVAGQSSGTPAGVVSGHGRRQRDGEGFVRRRESVRQTAGDIPEETFGFAGARAGRLSGQKGHGDLPGRPARRPMWFDTAILHRSFRSALV